MTDTSDCADKQRNEVAGAISNFVQNLPNGPSYHVGVMLAHASTTYSGALYTAGHSDAVVSSDTMSHSAMGMEVNYRLNHIQRENNGGGGKAGMYSVWKSVTTNLATLQAQGFYRPDAPLAVVFLTDQADICAAATPNATYCNGITSASLLAKLKALKGEMPVRIGYDCDSKINIPSPEGFKFDMCHPCDFPRDLKPISCLMTTIILQKRFKLKTPCGNGTIDKSRIKVYVNGKLVTTWTYNSGDNTVTLDDCTPGLGPCATIEIVYCETGAP